MPRTERSVTPLTARPTCLSVPAASTYSNRRNAYTGGLSIHDEAFKAIFQISAFVAHPHGNRQAHRITAARY